MLETKLSLVNQRFCLELFQVWPTNDFFFKIIILYAGNNIYRSINLQMANTVEALFVITLVNNQL